MAAVPVHLLEAGIVTEQRLAGLGGAPAALGDAIADRVRADKRVRIAFNPRDRRLTAARESCQVLADAVAASLRAGARPIVCGGECTVVAGTIPGAIEVEPDLLLVYFDAHGDFNTVATTPTHHVSGMCLAHVCGRQVAALLWPGARSIKDDQVVLVGGRMLDPGEAGNLAKSRVLRVPFDAEHADAPGLLAAVRRRPVWIHVDLDVVDPRDVDAVATPIDGGPRLRALSDVLRAVGAVADVRGLELCGYDPTKDPERRFVAPLAGLIADAVAVPVRAG